MVILAGLVGAEAFAPSGVAPASSRLALRASTARKSGLVGPKMMDASSIADGVQLIAANGVANVPFVDEVTGDGAGFTSPLSHFESVSTPSPIPSPLEQCFGSKRASVTGYTAPRRIATE